jgi:hypothetical protein
MSVSAAGWNRCHIHPNGSWWQYENDRRIAELTLTGLGISAILGAALLVWAVLAA